MFRSSFNWRKCRSAFAMAAAAALACAAVPGAESAGQPPTEPAAEPPAEMTVMLDNPLEEIVIKARDARYVARTTRDSIGRIWAPVYINGKGPFKLALDTGASGSALAAPAVAKLGADISSSPPVRLRGVAGTMTVPTVRAESLQIGDLYLKSTRMPVLPDAMGGADGVLGGEGLDDMRVYISFRYDRIEIRRSDGSPAPEGMSVIPFRHEPGRPPVVDAVVSGVRVKAVINTGGQNTIGNAALHDRMSRGLRAALAVPSRDKVTDITQVTTEAAGQSGASLRIGDVAVRYPHVSFADFGIFKAWGLDQTPAIIVGMDTLGLFDTIIIDYRRHELQLRLHH